MSKSSSKVSNENKQEMVFRPKFAENEFWGQNFKNLSPDLESVPPRYSVFQFSGKIDSIDFFGPNLPKNKLGVGNSKN